VESALSALSYPAVLSEKRCQRETVEVTAVGLTIPSMAVALLLVPLDDRGREIIDAFEGATNGRPTEVQEDGSRRYYLHGEDASAETLDRIDPDWQEHVTRASSTMV
jgi:hypothetical protein